MERNYLYESPYGREIGKWIKKAYEESRKDNCMVIGLIPSRTDTLWFHNYIMKANEIRFVKGRLKFLKDGMEISSATFPSIVVVWKKELNIGEQPKISTYFKDIEEKYDEDEILNKKKVKKMIVEIKIDKIKDNIVSLNLIYIPYGKITLTKTKEIDLKKGQTLIINKLDKMYPFKVIEKPIKEVSKYELEEDTILKELEKLKREKAKKSLRKEKKARFIKCILEGNNLVSTDKCRGKLGSKKCSNFKNGICKLREPKQQSLAGFVKNG